MARPLRLLTWNIGYLTDAEHPAAIPLQAAAIAYANPDIVFINEAMRLGSDDRDNQILELSALTQLKHVEFAVATDVGIFGFRGQKLIGVLSRFPLSNANPLAGVCDSAPDGGCYRTLEVTTMIDDRLYFLYSTRWSPHDEGNNIKIAEQLRDRILALQVNYREACFIVGGDLNQNPMSLLHAPPVTFTSQYLALVVSTRLTDSYMRDVCVPPVGVDTGMPNDYLLYRAPALARNSREGPGDGPGGGSGTDHSYEATALEPFDAQFIRQAIPAVVTVGQPVTFEFTFKNTSAFIWEPFQRISLVLQDSLGWTRVTAVLVSNVAPQDEVSFRFETTPTRIGQRTVQGRLVCQGVWRFGEAPPAVQVSVAAPNAEPAQCIDLRSQLSAIDARLLELTEGLTGDPREDAKAKIEIAQLTRTRARVTNDGQAIGCSF